MPTAKKAGKTKQVKKSKNIDTPMSDVTSGTGTTSLPDMKESTTELTAKSTIKYGSSQKSARQRAFLAAYAKCGVITQAIQSVPSLHKTTVHAWLREEPAFLARFDQAKSSAADALESEALRRAVEGDRVPVLYHGNQVRIPDPASELPWEQRPLVPLWENKKRSDALLAMCLRAAKPEKYTERLETRSTTLSLSFSGPLPAWFGATDAQRRALQDQAAESLLMPDPLLAPSSSPPPRRITSNTLQSSPSGLLAIVHSSRESTSDDHAMPTE